MHTVIPFNLKGNAGNIECNLHTPSTSSLVNNKILGISLILHPHPLFGGTMDNKIVQTLIRSVNDLGYIAVRFNFRGVGASEGLHDNGTGETEDAKQVLSYMKSTIVDELKKQNYDIEQNCDLILGGFSFGSFVAAKLYHELEIKPKKMLMVGTAAGKWDVPSIPNDSLIVHGDDDEVIPLAYAIEWAKKYDLPITIVPNAGHFFHGKLLILKQLIKQSLKYSWEK
jgi:alpha/beta superfamily hydrolase